MLLHDLLSRSAERTPDAIALIEPGRRVTYRELNRRAGAVAVTLAQAGVDVGDRVALALPNSIEFVAAYFGILRAGATVVPLQPGPRNDRLRKVLEDCAPRVCVVDPGTAPLVEGFDAPGTLPPYVVGGTPDADPGAASLIGLQGMVDEELVRTTALPALSENSLAAIIYTSGSTGEPRGVVLTHGNILANTNSIVTYLELSAADRMMVVLPFYYVYGLSLLHTHIAVGGSLVLDNRFAFPNVVLKAMQEHAVTGFAGVPSTFALLLHRSNIATTALPSLRYVTQAGGPMAYARIQEWLGLVPDVPFFVMYGATEASARLTYLPPEDLHRRQGSIGRGIPNVEMRVLRDDGSEAGPEEIGELVARGPNIAQGYWNRPEDTRQRFGPEGYRTGDLGYADADGFLYLVGRRSDMLKVGAHRVSASEIEGALHAHPAVHEVAVIGAPDEILGEIPVAYVVARDATLVTERDLLAFARARLAEHKVPARWVFLSELPKTAAGKLDKRALPAVLGRPA